LNALKFETAGEGLAHAEGLELAPLNCSEVVVLQLELNGAVREAFITKPVPQCPRTELIFNVFFEDAFLD